MGHLEILGNSYYSFSNYGTTDNGVPFYALFASAEGEGGELSRCNSSINATTTQRQYSSTAMEPKAVTNPSTSGLRII
jgi:hypothetical protein